MSLKIFGYEIIVRRHSIINLSDLEYLEYVSRRLERKLKRRTRFKFRWGSRKDRHKIPMIKYLRDLAIEETGKKMLLRMAKHYIEKWKLFEKYDEEKHREF